MLSHPKGLTLAAAPLPISSAAELAVARSINCFVDPYASAVKEHMYYTAQHIFDFSHRICMRSCCSLPNNAKFVPIVRLLGIMANIGGCDFKWRSGALSDVYQSGAVNRACKR